MTGLITRANIRAAFARIIGNNIFNATAKELDLIQDKAFVVKQEAPTERKLFKNKKNLPRVRELLQSHNILKKNIKKQTYKPVVIICINMCNIMSTVEISY